MLLRDVTKLIFVIQIQQFVSSPAKTTINLNNCNPSFQLNTADKNVVTAKQQLLCSGVYWNKSLENTVKLKQPVINGSLTNDTIFTKVLRGCGRLKNRLLLSSRNELFCARYRDSVTQLQGEAYSHSLAKSLHVDNVLPLFVIKINSSSIVWSQVWFDLQQAGWRYQAIVILTPWIENLQLVYAPQYLTVANASENAFSCKNMKTFQNEDVAFMMQWTNMVLFDYVTGNLDRLVNHFYNWKWDKFSLHHPIHNLMKTPSEPPSRGNYRKVSLHYAWTDARLPDLLGVKKCLRFLLFLDNESGFEHSYRVMAQYHQFHEASLKKLCIFQKKVLERLRYLNEISEARLEDFLVDSTSNILLLPRMNPRNLIILKQRLRNVYNHLMLKCGML